VKVVQKSQLSLTSNFVQCGVRYLIGLIDTVLSHDVAIGLAVPYIHGNRDLAEPKPPKVAVSS